MGVIGPCRTAALAQRESVLTSPDPGDLYWAQLESGLRRPFVVVSRECLNRGQYIVAVPVTSANLDVRWSLPNVVPFRTGDFGLTKNCVAQCEAITIVERDLLDPQPFARLSDEVWRQVVRAIGNVICADCEPT